MLLDLGHDVCDALTHEISEGNETCVRRLWTDDTSEAVIEDNMPDMAQEVISIKETELEKAMEIKARLKLEQDLARTSSKLVGQSDEVARLQADQELFEAELKVWF